MPTENRSSNTEMVSVPREPSSEMLKAARNAPIPLVHLDSISARQDLEFAARYKAAVARFPDSAPQPHPEPIAWMVGTAIWWTKEEAERYAAEVGQPVVGLGPMIAFTPSQQHGEPVAWLAKTLKGSLAGTLGLARYDQRLNPDLYEGPFPVFRHADPGEVERLQRALDNANIASNFHKQNCEDLRAQLPNWQALAAERLEMITQRDAQLAERDALIEQMLERLNKAQIFGWGKKVAALSASAEPSVPVEQDDPCKWTDQQVLDFLGVALRNVDLKGEVWLSEIRQGFEYMRDRAALARNP